MHFYVSSKKPRHKGLAKIFRSVMYPLALIAPVMTIPQVLDIWSKHMAANVSLSTWFAYGCTSLVWLVYGLVHNEKPIILNNILLAALQLAVVIGVIVYK